MTTEKINSNHLYFLADFLCGSYINKNQTPGKIDEAEAVTFEKHVQIYSLRFPDLFVSGLIGAINSDGLSEGELLDLSHVGRSNLWDLGLPGRDRTPAEQLVQMIRTEHKFRSLLTTMPSLRLPPTASNSFKITAFEPLQPNDKPVLNGQELFFKVHGDGEWPAEGVLLVVGIKEGEISVRKEFVVTVYKDDPFVKITVPPTPFAGQNILISLPRPFIGSIQPLMRYERVGNVPVWVSAVLKKYGTSVNFIENRFLWWTGRFLFSSEMPKNDYKWLYEDVISDTGGWVRAELVESAWLVLLVDNFLWQHLRENERHIVKARAQILRDIFRDVLRDAKSLLLETPQQETLQRGQNVLLKVVGGKFRKGVIQLRATESNLDATTIRITEGLTQRQSGWVTLHSPPKREVDRELAPIPVTAKDRSVRITIPRDLPPNFNALVVNLPRPKGKLRVVFGLE